MANTLYNIGREGFLTEVTVGAFVGKYDWVSDNIRAVLVDDTYTYNAAHTDFSDISAAVVADVALTGKSAAGNGTAVADNATFSAVTGDEVVAVILYRSDGAAPASTDVNCPLIGFLDEVSSGLPITPNGGDITALWNSGTGEVFRI